MFVVAETMIGVFNVAGSFFALANECPHAGASLAHGIVESDTVRCRIHHWQFCIRDGTYLDDDKACYNAKTFPVRVVGNEVQVAVGGETR
jgi:nitrite reductase/ring-hydroxylating ferredoxin subunit